MKNTFDIFATNVVHWRVGRAKFYIHSIDPRVISLENGAHWRRHQSIHAFLAFQHRPVIHSVDNSSTYIPLPGRLRGLRWSVTGDQSTLMTIWLSRFLLCILSFIVWCRLMFITFASCSLQLLMWFLLMMPQHLRGCSGCCGEWKGYLLPYLLTYLGVSKNVILSDIK